MPASYSTPLIAGVSALLLLASGADAKCCCCVTSDGAPKGGLVSSEEFPPATCPGAQMACHQLAKDKRGPTAKGHTFETDKPGDSCGRTKKSFCEQKQTVHSLVPAAGKGKLVMDFDCTLSKNHLWKTTHTFRGSDTWEAKVPPELQPLSHSDRWMNADFATWIMGGPSRIAMLRTELGKWKEAGFRVEVCTLSEPERVETILYNTGLDTLVDRIHGKLYPGGRVDVRVVLDKPQTSWVSYSPPPELFPKQAWVKEIAKTSPVMFVDDSAENYGGLERAENVRVFGNQQAHLVKDGEGLTAEMLQSMLATMDGAPTTDGAPTMDGASGWAKNGVALDDLSDKCAGETEVMLTKLTTAAAGKSQFIIQDDSTQKWVVFEKHGGQWSHSSGVVDFTNHRLVKESVGKAQQNKDQLGEDKFIVFSKSKQQWYLFSKTNAGYGRFLRR